MRSTVSLILSLAFSASLLRGEVSFEQRSIALNGVSYTYGLFVPAGAAPAKGWPLIVFLHGIGERGDDGVRQTTVGIGPAIKAHPER